MISNIDKNTQIDFILKLILLVVITFSSTNLYSQSSVKSIKGMVKVYMTTDDEERVLPLRHNQTALVYVYLSSLGDPLDKFMVSIVSNEDNKLIANSLSNKDGIVVFRKIEPGDYTVYVNRRVVRDDEFSSVRVADVRLRAYP